MSIRAARTEAGIFIFSACFLSAGFPRTATVASTGCGASGGDVPALCKVLAKLLGPCPAGCEARDDFTEEPGPTTAGWMRLVSTKSVFRSALPLNACGEPKPRIPARGVAETK